MVKNQSTYTLQIDADIQKILGKVNGLKKNLSGLFETGEAPKGLVKSFDQIASLIGGIQDKTSKPLVSNSEFVNISKDLGKLEVAFGGLARQISLLDDLPNELKISLLPKEEQARLLQAVKALKEYNSALEEIAKRRALLEKAQKQQLAKKKELDTSEKKVASTEGKISKRTETKTELKKQLDLIDDKSSEKAKKLTTDIANLEKEIELLNDQLETAKKGQNAASNAFNQSTTIVKNLSTSLNNLETESLENLRKEAKELGISLEEISGETPADEMSRLATAINQTSARTKEVSKQIDQYGKEAKDGAKDTGELNRTVGQAAESFRDLTDAVSKQEEFERKIKSFLGISGAAQVMRAALRDAMQTITELDATMTEMSVVTDLGVGDYWDQLPQYTKRANELGLAIKDVYQADTLFYQQDLKTNEVVAISTETMKMARISGLDTAEATDRMTAALRGFNMELNETSAKKVADVYSELAAITAADTEEISAAMTKTASIASSAGMEFETTAAFLSQIIETTRESAETAGTALKTVIARFQELKKDPSEIGAVDGEIVDANQIETALRSVGVALRDSSGQFRELDDVFLELSSKWSGLDKNTQRYIATIAAGSRQQSRFIAMMSDYGRTQELVTAANNSAGASNRQFEKTLESLDAKLEKLKNAWHEFTMGILESDLVKFGVDLLTKFLEVINNATSAFDGLGGSITKIASVLAVFKLGSKIFDKIRQPLADFFIDLVKMSGESGEKSAKAYRDGVKKVLQEEQSNEQNEEQKKKQEEDELKNYKPKETGKALVSRKLGVTDIKEGWKTIHGSTREKREALQDEITKNGNRKQRTSKLRNLEQDRDLTVKKYGEQSEQVKQYDTEILNAKKSLKDLDKAEKEYFDESKKGWDQVGDGISKIGEAAMGVGAGISMIGGMLSSLGLEQIGESVSGIGNAIILVGSVLTTIPPMITAIQTILKAPPLGIILVILGAVLALIIAIVAIINNNPAEKKLKQAGEAAERAKEAADAAAESYENLVNSLDELDDKYKALEELTKGTKEWNEAVQEINSSVLDLIDKYPELAGLVKTQGGVLKLDTNSDAVQQVIQQAQARKITSQNAAIMANVAVANAQAEKYRSDMVKKNSKAQFVYSDEIRDRGQISYTDQAAVEKNRALGITNTEDAKKKNEQIAKALASGDAGTTFGDFVNYLKDEMGVASEAASELASQFWQERDSLRQYGNSLNQADAQQRAAYDSIASSAQLLANTMGISAEQIQQSSNIVDGELSGQLYEEKMNELKNLDTKDLSKNSEVQAAIREKYGASATIDKDGKVTYHDGTENKEITLNADEIKSIVATQYATKETAKAIEYSDDAITKLSATAFKRAQAAGGEGAEERANLMSKAINSMYMEGEGKNLTSAELKSLENLTEDDYQAMWESLSPDEKSIYGGDIEKMEKDFTDSIDFASKAFDRAEKTAETIKDANGEQLEVIQDFMTSNQAEAFSKKMKDVFDKSGGEGAQKILDNFNAALEGKSEEEKQRIAEVMNAYDWSTIESLHKMQLELTNVYGVQGDAAKNLVNTIIAENHAIGSLATTINVFGETYESLKALEISQEKITDLQWQYNYALEAGSEIIGETLSELADAYEKQYNISKEGYQNAANDLATIYGQGGNIDGYNLLDEISFNTDDEGNITGINTSKIKENTKLWQNEKVQNWVASIEEQLSQMKDFKESGREAVDALEGLKKQNNDATIELKNQIKNTILNGIQEQIDTQKELLDVTRDANSQLISKIQEQINTQRQEQQNLETEKNISDMYSKLSYLQMDTGGNSIEAMALEKDIAKAEEDYRQTLIDQSIQSLQDANAKAEEQRERQIALQEDALESYSVSEELQAAINDKMEKLLSSENPFETAFGERMAKESTLGMSQEERDAQMAGMSAMIAQAKDVSVEDVLGALKTEGDFTAKGTTITNLGKEKALTERRGRAAQTGMANAETATENQLAAHEALIEKDSQTDVSSQAARLKKAKEDKNGAWNESELGKYYDSAFAYYQDGGVDGQSYSEWVTSTDKKIGRFGDEEAEYNRKRVEFHQVPLRTDGIYEMDGYNRYDFDETSLGLNKGSKWMKRVIMLKQGSTVTIDDVQAKASDYNNGFFYYDGNVYHSTGGMWWRTQGPSGTEKQIESYNELNDTLNAMYPDKKKEYQFKTGGLADFTGPAWLDGTPSKPEYILNAAQTEKFFSLVDVLEGFDKKETKTSSGDNYFDIEINVEKLENDYDVEKIADKIRRMIYEDASYRNVNAISHIR